MKKHGLAASAVALLAVSTFAQTTAAGRLIGFSGSGIAFTPSVSRQQLCAPMSLVCPTGLPVASGHAGGAAYNAIQGSVWLTQGTRMEERRISDCALLCSAPANLVLGAGSVASGLAIRESAYQLLQLESVPGQAAVSTRHIRSCPPQVIAACRFPLPTNRHVAGAIAVNERNGEIFYATSVFGGLAAPQNTVMVARIGNPCNIVCQFPVAACGANRLGPLVAAAYDECSNALYLSDGVQTVCLRRSTTGPVCVFSAATCCPIGISGARWFGFDIEPNHVRSVGSSCVGVNCVNCPNQALQASGDPSIGNPAFAIAGTGLPAGTMFSLGVSVGRCNLPGIPVSCGRYILGPGAVFFPPVVVGGIGCQGTAVTNLPVPVNYALCGVPLCFQGFVVCRRIGVPGLSVLNGLELVIGS